MSHDRPVRHPAEAFRRTLVPRSVLVGVLRDHLPDEIRTGRLLLRRPRPDDADALFAIEGDPLTAAHRPDGPRTRDGSDADLARYLRDWAEDLLGYWFVDLDGALVGTTGQRRFDAPMDLLPGVEPESLLNTYYRFSPLVWGTGVPTEAAQAAVDATLAAGSPHDLVAMTIPANEPSQRMAVRLGMPFHRRVARGAGQLDTVEHRLRVH